MSDHHGPPAPVAALLVVGLLALVALSSWLVAISRRPEVAVVGDSITVVSNNQITDRLFDDHQVAIAAALGVTVEVMQPEAQRLARSEPDQVVIELGSNDVLLGLPLDEAAAGLAEMVATFEDAGAECVHLVDVSTVMVTSGGASRAEEAATLNAEIEALAAADERVVVIGWDAAVREAEAAGAPLVTDTVHPSPEGSEVLAELIGESIEEGCDR